MIDGSEMLLSREVGSFSTIIYKVLAPSKRWFSRRISEPSTPFQGQFNGGEYNPLIRPAISWGGWYKGEVSLDFHDTCNMTMEKKHDFNLHSYTNRGDF